ncbi:MAG: hypothetical protein QOG04_1575 [Actinomycetota bacterium]|jgi:hypothetical protein|nr:hypothetical protein [Actinomycetota bacterium]
MSEERIYTVPEANELLPYLAPTLVELREKFEEASRIRSKMATASRSNGWSTARDEWATKLARVDELMDRITGWNIQLRDISSGLVDFPGMREGEEIWLCWRLGEPEVGYWHSREEGFGGREPL